MNYLHELLEFNYDFLQAEDVQRGLNEVYTDEVKEEDLTFWVDPLDGSNGMSEGHVDHVTCIMGVAVKKRPLLGVVHKPFVDHAFGNRGSTYIGLP